MPSDPRYVGTEVVRSPGVPDLLVRTRRSDHRFTGDGTVYRVGRDPDSQIVLTDSRVSWKHGVLRAAPDGWVFEDTGSTNGTFLGGQRVQRVDIAADCVLHLGDPDDGPVLRCMPQLAPAAARHAPVRQAPAPVEPIVQPAEPVVAEPQVQEPAVRRPSGQPPSSRRAAGAAGLLPSVDRRPTQRLQLPAKTLRIGRHPDNDIALSGDLEVSRHHAELRNTPTGSYEIVDLGSYNGTYVNGERVTRKLLTEQDIVSIGHSTFRLADGELRQYVDEGEVTFAAHDLVVRVGKTGKVLLDHISFPIPEKCLLGIIGPSGAGKSTLLGALTGMRPADTGTVLYDNRDLYRYYAELRHRIGLVPQESVLHTQLTARRALQYSAELRFPKDTRTTERNARISEVMGELGLAKHAETRADRLSGGQLKRVNVAQELLTKPSLLFLDEPTSGLDPGLDKSVMEQMRDLAHDGRTIIVVTHSVANLDTCDRLLVLVPGGRIAYYGPPAEGLSYFGLPGWAEVFQAFERYPDRDWAAEYAASPAYQRYIASELAKPPAAAANGHRPAAAETALPPRGRGAVRQLSTLTRRYLRVIATDRGYLAFMALMPLALGALLRVLPAKQGLAGAPGSNTVAVELLLMLIIFGCLAGIASSIRELVKERVIYVRERAAGLSSGAYLSSKLLVLGVLNVAQAAVLTFIGVSGRALPRQGAFLSGFPLGELAVAVAGVALASMCLGLLVSALVSTSEKTMPALVLATLAQVVFTGGLFALTAPGLTQIAWLAPARWGFAAAAATVDLNTISPAAGVHDALWQHAASTWLRDMAVMLGLAVVFAVMSWIRLRRLSPGRRR